MFCAHSLFSLLGFDCFFNLYLADLGYSELGFIMVDLLNQSCRVETYILNQTEIITAHTDFSENTGGFSKQNIISVSSIGRIIGLLDEKMIDQSTKDAIDFSRNLVVHELIHAFYQSVAIVKDNKIVPFLPSHHNYRGTMNHLGGRWSEADRYLLQAIAMLVAQIRNPF